MKLKKIVTEINYHDIKDEISNMCYECDNGNIYKDDMCKKCNILYNTCPVCNNFVNSDIDDIECCSHCYKICHYECLEKIFITQYLPFDNNDEPEYYLCSLDNLKIKINI